MADGAVNLAIDEAKLKFNPFSSIVPERDISNGDCR